MATAWRESLSMTIEHLATVNLESAFADLLCNVCWPSLVSTPCEQLQKLQAQLTAHAQHGNLTSLIPL